MKKLLVRLAISLVIGGGMLYLAARKIDFGTTWSALGAAQWWVLLPYFASMAVQHFFRAWRWGYLLAPIHPVPFRRLLPVATVGFAAIIALPLRMGELVRPYLIADPPRIRMSQAFGTMAVERVFDGLILALTCFSVVSLAERHTDVPSWLMAAGLIALVVFLAALVVLIMTLWQRERAVTLCRRLFGLISPRLGDRLAQVAQGIVQGFSVLPDWRRLLPFLGGTVAYWLFNGVAVWVLGIGFGLEGLGLYESVAVMAIVGIGIMIPAGPGFIGNFELFAHGALGLYLSAAVVDRSGAAYILTFHATNALWYAATGALGLMSSQVSFNTVWRASAEGTEALTPEQAAIPGEKLDNPSCSSDAG